MPTLERTQAQPYLLPAVVVGGPRFGALVKHLYGAMLVLLVAVCACSLIGYGLPEGSHAHENMNHLHTHFGLGILGLFCLRSFVQLVDYAQPLQPPLVDWRAWATQIVQWALYLFMLALSLAGWLMLNAAGKHPVFYGLALPVLVAPDPGLASALSHAHAGGAMLGYLLMGLNIVAWLYQRPTLAPRQPPLRR